MTLKQYALTMLAIGAVAITGISVVSTVSRLRTSRHIPPLGNYDSSIVRLNADVCYTGTEFVITNNDTFDWTNVRMEVNSKGIIKCGYEWKTLSDDICNIQAGQKYAVGAIQFIKRGKGDGVRFNTFTTEPKDFHIFCDTPQGKLTGFWHGNCRIQIRYEIPGFSSDSKSGVKERLRLWWRQILGKRGK